MAGNAYEWTTGEFKPYPYNPTDGREQRESTGGREMHGGSRVGNASYARAAYRGAASQDYVASNLGFRLARSAPNA